MECAGRATQLLHHTCHFFGGLSLDGEHLCWATRDHVGDLLVSLEAFEPFASNGERQVCRERGECLGSATRFSAVVQCGFVCWVRRREGVGPERVGVTRKGVLMEVLTAASVMGGWHLVRGEGRFIAFLGEGEGR